MNSRILIDTGPLVALFDSSDKHHNRICEHLKKNEYRFISTLAVYTESCYSLRFDANARQNLFKWVTHRGIIIADINQHDIPSIAELMNKYSDLPMDFTDATLLIAAEKTGIMDIITIDKDFDIYRLHNKKKLNNVYLASLLKIN